MEAQLNKLKDFLAEEIAIHDALKGDLRHEAEQDGKMNGAELLRLQRQKNQQVGKLRELELLRIKLVRELAGAWGEDPDGLTLKRIIPRASPPLAGELLKCHGQLMELVSDIQELSRETSANAQARLRAVEATLAVINEAVQMHPTYSEEGRLQKVTPTFKQTSA